MNTQNPSFNIKIQCVEIPPVYACTDSNVRWERDNYNSILTLASI